MKYIGENAIKKLISLIKGDLATKQDSIAATGVLERDTTGVINGVETVGATLVETQEAKLVDVPNGLLKGDGTTISAAVAGTDYVNSSQAIRYDTAQSLTDAQKTQARSNIGAANKETQDKVLAVSVPTRSISLAASEVQGYLDALPRLLTERLEIRISGTVPETLTIRNFYGPGGLTITNQSGQTYALAKGMLLDNCDIPIIVWWASITVDTAQETPHCVSISNTKYVYMSSCVLTGNGASRGVSAMGNQSTVLVSCTMTNHKICAFAFRGAVLTITGGTFADNTTGAYVYDGGVILLCDTTPNLLGGTANSHGGGVIVSANGTVI